MAMGSVAAWAAEFEGNLSKMLHDFASTKSDLQEMGVELSKIKKMKDLEGVKKNKEKIVQMKAIGKGRDNFSTKADKLDGVVKGLKVELCWMEKEKSRFMKKIQVLEGDIKVGKNKGKLLLNK